MQTLHDYWKITIYCWPMKSNHVICKAYLKGINLCEMQHLWIKTLCTKLREKYFLNVPELLTWKLGFIPLVFVSFSEIQSKASLTRLLEKSVLCNIMIFILLKDTFTKDSFLQFLQHILMAIHLNMSLEL